MKCYTQNKRYYRNITAYSYHLKNNYRNLFFNIKNYKTMNIENSLKISYEVKSKNSNKENLKFSFFVDGEEILIMNSNFSNLNLDDQLLIVNSFIKKDRMRYKTKEFFYQRWEEVEQ